MLAVGTFFELWSVLIRLTLILRSVLTIGCPCKALESSHDHSQSINQTHTKTEWNNFEVMLSHLDLPGNDCGFCLCFWVLWHVDVIDTECEVCSDYRMSLRSHRELSWPFMIITKNIKRNDAILRSCWLTVARAVFVFLELCAMLTSLTLNLRPVRTIGCPFGAIESSHDHSWWNSKRHSKEMISSWGHVESLWPQ